MERKARILIAVTGASGSVYAKLIIEKLLSVREQWDQLALVMTENAKTVWKTELEDEAYLEYPLKTFDQRDFNAPFASGSGQFNVMIIAPCSMGVLGRIASGISNDLITRAADVVLKERRKLICLVRETPYNLVHIRNMETLSLAGGIICPASPSFYSKPKTINELAATVADRVLDLAGINIESFRWGNEPEGSGIKKRVARPLFD